MIRLLVVLVVLSLVAPAGAQGVITQRTLSLGLANTLAQTAMGCAMGRGYHVSVTVVDRAGETMVVLRDPEAGPFTMENSRRKAYTARAVRMSSAKFAEAWFANDHTRVAQGTLPGMIPLAGGLPINAGADIVGGIGLSGSPGGENDELCAQRAIDGVAGELKAGG